MILLSTRLNITNAFKDLFAGKKNLALVDVPTHGNYGDTVLWDGERHLSSNFGHELSYLCAQCQTRYSYLDRCNWDDLAKVVERPADWLILYHGGGNWGTIYKSVHRCRLNLLREYLAAGLTVISMPQSVFYDLDSTANMEAFENGKLFWEKEAPMLPGRMVMACRQHDSCDDLATHFPKLEIRRVPDIAFMIPPVYARSDPVTDIVFLVRRDSESVSGYEHNLQIVAEMLRGGSLTHEVYDWHQIGKLIPGAVPAGSRQRARARE